jgi:hypothetical protein
MKLIFIHGRAQQGKDVLKLTQEWKDAWTNGLHEAKLSMPENIKIEFPYYGDLLIDLIKEAEAPQIVGAAHRSGQMISESAKNEFYDEFLKEIAEKSPLTAEERIEFNEIKNATRGKEDSILFHKLLKFLDKSSVASTLAIEAFTRDVFMYLSVAKIKKGVNEAVLKSFDNEPCVVVGHSLGSVVSYLVLKNNPNLNVKKFITIGSPLGISGIRKKVEPPIEMPKCIQNGWFNAFDSRDIVALRPLNQEFFNVKPSIEHKNDVNNHTTNRHGIEGYLNDPVIARKIYEALIM